MLARRYRLKKNNDFRAVFSNGKISRGELTDLRATSNGLAFCRFGFIVGLKISKKAVVRNRIKRQLSEIAGKITGAAGNGQDIVISVKPKIIGKLQGEIIDDIKKNIKNNRALAIL